MIQLDIRSRTEKSDS